MVNSYFCAIQYSQKDAWLYHTKGSSFSSSLHTHIFVLAASRNWKNGGCLFFEHKFFNYKCDIAINNKKRFKSKILYSKADIKHCTFIQIVKEMHKITYIYRF